MRGIYKISSNTDKKASMRANTKIWEARASEHFASKSSKGKILRAVKNFHGLFITPSNGVSLSLSSFLISFFLGFPKIRTENVRTDVAC